MKKITLVITLAMVSVLAVVLLGCGGSNNPNKDIEGTWVCDTGNAKSVIVLNSDGSGLIYGEIYGQKNEDIEKRRPLTWKLNADNSITINYENITGPNKDATLEFSQDKKTLTETLNKSEYKKQ